MSAGLAGPPLGDGNLISALIAWGRCVLFAALGTLNLTERR